MFNILKRNIRLNSQDKNNIELIRKSKYFDATYYMQENPKVKGDPCKHYYYYGWKEGYSPSYNFSTTFYLENNKDVADSEINPLLHYLKFGERENRIIEKDNGLSLKKAYERIYNCAYFYKVYVEKIEINRVNLFFDNIDKSIFKMENLFKFLIKYIKDNKHELRIIYSKADFDELKHFLKKANLMLPENTKFLNLKSNNYLEIGLKEKFVCTSWKTARALLNSSSIHDRIYFYLNDVDENKYDDYYQISNICTNPRVFILLEEEQILKKIKKCQLIFKTNQKNYQLRDYNKLYCQFDNLFITSLELLNEIFLNNILNSQNWYINILNSKDKFKFHFDTNVNVKMINNKIEDLTLMFRTSFIEQEINEDYPVIYGYIKKKEYNKFNYITLKNEKFNNEFNKNEKIIVDYKNDEYILLKKCIQNLEKR